MLSVNPTPSIFLLLAFMKCSMVYDEYNFDFI